MSIHVWYMRALTEIFGVDTLFHIFIIKNKIATRRKDVFGGEIIISPNES